MQAFEVVISAFITIFSFGLLCVSLKSYRKHNNIKLLIIGLVFFVFLIKAILVSIGLFYPNLVVIEFDLYSGLFDFAILLLLFIATLKR